MFVGRSKVFSVGFYCLLTVAFCFPGAIAEGFAQESNSGKSARASPSLQGQSTTGWVVNCTSRSAAEALSCQVSQDVNIKDTGQRLVSVILRQGDKQQGLSMLLALPHGLFFPAGVSLSIDNGKTRKVAMQTSDPRGSYAAFNVNAEFLSALKRGNTLAIGVENVQRKSMTFDVSLSGFTAAVEKLLDVK